MGIELSRKARRFADSYFGGSSELRGSAKACYKYVHPQCKDSTAATEGPALLRNPHVQGYLDEQGQKISERAEVNAQWVLEQSVRLYKMAAGEIPVIEERIVEKQGENGNTTYETEYVELRKTDLGAAIRALEMIGKHMAVQAFSKKVEVSHTHRLEQALARRGKLVEDAVVGQKLELVE
jgi:hypothetical protein